MNLKILSLLFILYLMGCTGGTDTKIIYRDVTGELIEVDVFNCTDYYVILVAYESEGELVFTAIDIDEYSPLFVDQGTIMWTYYHVDGYWIFYSPWFIPYEDCIWEVY